MRGVRLAWADPGAGALLARMAAWRIVLPLLKHALPLPRLVRLMGAEPRRRPRSRTQERLVVELAQRLYGARRVADRRCLDRSLVVYRFLSRLDADPRLVVGLGKRDGETVGHVWVTVDGRPVHDSAADLAPFEPVVTFAVRS